MHGVKKAVCALGFTCLFCLSVCVAQNSSTSSARPYTPFGGDHEFGAWAGYSGFTGPIWGYSRDVHYTTVGARYSYHLASYQKWDIRYAPEATLLAVLHETKQTDVNPAAPNTRYGGGLSPVGFQAVYRPERRIQPYAMTDSGFVYYNDRVLSPQGSQYMFVIDFGGGANFFLSRRTAMQLGYRYMHTSNANISVHNPGADNQIFYVGLSHFHTRGQR